VGDLCKPCAQATAHIRTTGQSEFQFTTAGLAVVGFGVSLIAWALVLYLFVRGGAATEAGLWSFVRYSFMAGALVGGAVSMAAGRKGGLVNGTAAFISTVAGYLVVVFGWALHDVYAIGGNAIVIWVPGFLLHTAINAGLAGLAAAVTVSRLRR
jgi:hypothetical protein